MFITYFQFFLYRVIIPDVENDAGVNPANIVRQYLKALNTDLKNLTPDSPLFYRGNPASGAKPSMFVNQPMSTDYLQKIARWIAGKKISI